MKKVKVEVKLAARLLQVSDGDGDFRVEVPGESKVTFGPALPVGRKERMMTGMGEQVYALRVYKGPTERAGLLAVFPGITGFRDLGEVKVHRPARQDNGEIGWVEDTAWRAGKQLIEKLNPTPIESDLAGFPLITASQLLGKQQTKRR